MKLSFTTLIIFFILGLFILFHFSLIAKTFLIDEQGNIRTTFSGYGDIPLHLTQASKFSYTSLFNVEEPIFAGERMRYPFFINWISGLIFKIAGNFSFAFHFPAMLFFGAGTLLTFLIFRRFLKKEWLALFAVLLFFFGAGFGSYELISGKLLGESMSIPDFLSFLVDKNISTINKLDASFPEQPIVWGAPLSLVFLHQRAFFLGYFLFALYVFLLLKFQEKPTQRYFYPLIAILGLSPLAHFHSFLAMGFVSVVFAVLHWSKNNKELAFKALRLIFFAAIIALPEIWYLAWNKDIGFFSGDHGFFTPRLGWMAKPGIGQVVFPLQATIFGNAFAYLKFLWLNFGLILPIFLFTIYWRIRTKIKTATLDFFILSGIFLFLIVQLIQFQPWDYDNNKILVYFQFFAAPVAILFLWRLVLKRRVLGAVLFALVFLVSIHAGVLDLVPRYLAQKKNLPVVFDASAVSTAEYIRENIPQNALILTSATHQNPVSSLAGRPVLLGYTGWLWTRNIVFRERERSIQAFYANPLKQELLQEYDIGYILLDPMAMKDWGANKELFNQLFQSIFEQDQFVLYRVSP